MTKDFIERFAELIKDDIELHDAVVRAINAHAEAQELKNAGKKQHKDKQYACATCFYKLYNPGSSPCNGCMNVWRNNSQNCPNMWKEGEGVT